MLIEKLTVPPLEENCYLFAAAVTGRCAVVDPGAESGCIFAAIERRGLTPERILLTHGHVDHIAHCGHVEERYGLGVWIHAADLSYLERPQWPELEAFLQARPCPKPAGWLDEGVEVAVAGLVLRVLHTPGHTPGGICLIDEASREILVGDTIFHRGVGRTDLPGGDGPTLARSIREKLFPLGGDYRLLPGHGPETSLDDERRENPFVGAAVALPAW